MRVSLVVFLAFFPLAACQASEVQAGPVVEIGVFYGGQVQKLGRVEVSAVSSPKFGFRARLPKPASQAVLFESEVVFLGAAGRRVTRSKQLTLPAGQTQLDHVIEWKPGSRQGLWNVRVQSQGRVLADRALYLTSAAP